MKAIIGHEELKEWLWYDAEQGVFIWKKQPSDGPIKPGQRAGSYDSEGYRTIKINRRQYREHRLAWFYITGEWPCGCIDHINMRKDDNRFANLRVATNAQNQANTGMWASNTSGLKGVSWSSAKKRWRACMNHEGKSVLQRYFMTKEDARTAYCDAAARYRGGFVPTTNSKIGKGGNFE